MPSAELGLGRRGPAGRFLSGLRCFVRLQGMNIKSMLSYAVDTWIEMALFALQQMTGLIFLWVVFSRVRAVGGWTLPEIVFLYGLLVLSMAFYRLVFQGVRDTGYMIMYGALDQLLTKPRSVLLLLSCRRSNITGAMDFITGLALVIAAGFKMDYEWSPGRVAQLAVFVVSGNAIMVAVMMAQAATCFWLVRFTVLHELIMALRRFCHYPIGIYGAALRVLVSAAIPLAFCSYYPAAVLLAKDGLSAWWALGPPLVAVASLAAAVGLFKLGQRAYESTGS
jgi:ABC-2 type transport system permease protein